MPTIQIKATDEEVATLKLRAEEETLSVAAYIRQYVPELADEPRPQGRPRKQQADQADSTSGARLL